MTAGRQRLRTESDEKLLPSILQNSLLPSLVAMSSLTFRLFELLTRNEALRGVVADVRERWHESRRSPDQGYSQHGEDVWLWKYFGERNSGFYIDVGASSPIRLSNTYLFYKAGWHGITVDPIQSLCASHCRLRPRDINRNSGVGLAQQMATFYELIPSVLSTFDKAWAEKKLADGALLRATYDIPIIPLSSLLNDCLTGQRDYAIDFLSVDVEGLDDVVLRSNDWDRFRPHVVMYECNNPAQDHAASFLATVGYSPLKNLGCNRLFVSE